MRAPVSVSMQDTSGSWFQLPANLAGVRFKTAAPGGCTEATIPLSESALLPDLRQGSPVRIGGGDSGTVLWSGRISSPVRQVRGVLESGDPSIEGQAGFLADQKVRYTPLVSRLDAWWLGSEMKPFVAGATAASGTLPVQGYPFNALMLQLPSGYVTKPYSALASFHGFFENGHGSSQGIRAIVARHREGAKAANRNKFQTFIWHGNRPGNVSWSSNAVSPSQKMSHLFDPSVSADVTIGLNYIGPAVDTNKENPTVSSDELWSGWWEMQVFRQIKRMTGSTISGWNPIGTAPSGASGLWPHEIVKDAIGNFQFITCSRSEAVSQIDDTSNVLVTSYDFTDDVTLAEILTDLMSLVPTHFWHADPVGTTGTFPLRWTRWTDTDTLLMPPGAVSYDEAAGDVDLANVVPYTYTDTSGREARATVAADPYKYPDVIGMGRVESDVLDLTALSSPTAAKQVATAYLDQVARLPKSAKATVSVPVASSTSGALLPPWELQAGVRAHVPETGETLPVTECEVDVDTATATLTLGTPRRTTDQIVATMTKHRRRA